HFDYVLGLLDAEVGQLADVHQAVLARQELNERAELLDGDDLAAVDLADLGFGGHALDRVHRDLHAFGGDRVDVDGAVVFDVDLAAGFFDELLDVLAAGADQQADLLGVDTHCRDPRRIFTDLRTRSSERLGHLGQDVQARDAGLLHGFGHHTVRDAGQFEIELEAGDALLGASDLAVHVAEGVFPADDVGQEFVARNLVLGVVFGAKADADAADRASHGHARVHERQAAAANGGHRGGAVGLHDFAGDANGIGVGLDRHHRFERALGQGTVPNLAPARAADATGFADGEVREVVVQDELLFGGAPG